MALDIESSQTGNIDMNGGSVGNNTAVSSTVILATLQNIATALNTQSQNNTNIGGASNFVNATSQMLVKSGAGRIVNVSVIIAGSSTGSIADANTIPPPAGSTVYVINNAIGLTVLNIPVKFGIVITPGAGMEVSGSYS